MDPYNSYTINTTSSSSSSYNSHNSFNSYTPSIPSNDQYQKHDEKNMRPPPPFRSALHSVSKTTVMKKQPIAPMPPTKPKVYKVDRVDFMDLVQKLTGAADKFKPTRLQKVAPPPLDLSPPVTDSFCASFMAEVQDEKTWKSFESTFGGLSPLGFSLSSPSWYSSIQLSPGTVVNFA